MNSRRKHTFTPVLVDNTDYRDVSTKILDKEYVCKLPYGTKPVKPCGKVDLATAVDADAEFAAVKAALAKYEADMATYKATRDAYNAENSRLQTKFREDVEAENGMTDHPKRDLLWSKAWERGHSSGFSDVLSAYDDLVELVK